MIIVIISRTCTCIHTQFQLASGGDQNKCTRTEDGKKGMIHTFCTLVHGMGVSKALFSVCVVWSTVSRLPVKIHPYKLSVNTTQGLIQKFFKVGGC